MADRVRVLLSTDDPLARAGLGALLAGHEGVALVDAVDDADVVLWPQGDGVPAPRAGAPLVALVADERGGGRALRQGARGVLLRDVDGPTLAAALVAVARGLVVVDPVLRLVQREPETREAALTPREREVLQLVALGMANKQIAARLGVSESTVKFHVNSLLEKLGARSRTDAVVRATRLGLLVL